jgi:hypothetical protein
LYPEQLDVKTLRVTFLGSKLGYDHRGIHRYFIGLPDVFIFVTHEEIAPADVPMTNMVRDHFESGLASCSKVGGSTVIFENHRKDEVRNSLLNLEDGR